MNIRNNKWSKEYSCHGETAHLLKLNGALFNAELSARHDNLHAHPTLKCTLCFSEQIATAF